MSKDGIWLENPETGAREYFLYDDLDPETVPQLLRPIGGFCYPASNFLRLPLPEVPFYVKNWLPKHGKAEVYGRAKSGKSFLAVQLARCIGSGDDFLGVPTEKARVLYLQFELGEGILQYRMKQSGEDYENVYVGTSFTMKLDTHAGQDTVMRAICDVEPRVVILDPFYKIQSGDENESTDVKKITDFLDEVIEKFDVAVFILHHAGKDPEKGGRGSSILEGWVDSYLEIKRTSKLEDPLQCKVTPKMLRHSAATKPIEIELGDDFEFHVSGGKTTTYTRVLDAIRKEGETTGGKLIASGIGKRKAVYDAIARLTEQGIIHKDGYTLTVVGEKERGK